MKTSNVKRTLRLNKLDGTYIDLPIVKATAIHIDVGMFHLDKLQNGYRLIVSDDIIDDMSLFHNFEMIREE